MLMAPVAAPEQSCPFHEALQPLGVCVYFSLRGLEILWMVDVGSYLNRGETKRWMCRLQDGRHSTLAARSTKAGIAFMVFANGVNSGRK